MKKIFTKTLILGLVLINPLSIVYAEQPASPPAQLNAVIADINGIKLTVADFQAYIRMRMPENRQPEKLNPAQRNKIFNEYINREILYQEALKKRVDQNAVIKADIENQRRNIIVSYALKQLLLTPINEDEIRSVYNKEFAQSEKEFKTRHILVKSEAQAKQIIKQLDRGMNFTQLATKYSIDASGKKGGELAWFSYPQMVAPFSQATQKLSNGSYTRTPVQTRFGWHIIKLDGTREVSPPAYEKVRDIIIGRINTRRITAYLNDLRERSDISIANFVGATRPDESTQ